MWGRIVHSAGISTFKIINKCSPSFYYPNSCVIVSCFPNTTLHSNLAVNRNVRSVQLLDLPSSNLTLTHTYLCSVASRRTSSATVRHSSASQQNKYPKPRTAETRKGLLLVSDLLGNFGLRKYRVFKISAPTCLVYFCKNFQVVLQLLR